ncbi:Transcription-repair-coupling factor [Botrimarina colliarenosi]|uniref:Transcription-repair-coupling factor n=1 Tax=Botrimarina colliarenosi TaxID=2528001 RepID=A0A5C6AM74_9BACT|nr:transcription-repair coupling factor [Botrimarina colliarenosi]TWU00102.1 Transcription-repair-coupling factor [Botrimarina colliarenosi]
MSTEAPQAPTGPAPPSAAAVLTRLTEPLTHDADFARVAESLNAGHGGTLGGVWGSSRALVAAALAQRCPGPLVVLLPHLSDVVPLAADLANFVSDPATVAMFPAWQTDAADRRVSDDAFGARLRTLKTLDGPLEGAPRIVVSCIQALLQPTPTPDAIAEATRRLAVGETIDVEELCKWLVAHGCHRTTAVELPGEVAVRGGIVDLFAPEAERPVRIELFGDEIESIRSFDAATQRSVATLAETSVTMLDPTKPGRAHFTAHLAGPAGQNAWFALIEPADLEEEGKFFHERSLNPATLHSVRMTLAEVFKHPSVTLAGVPAGSFEETGHLAFESVERLSGQAMGGDVNRLRDELETIGQGQRVVIVCPTEAEIHRLRELLSDSKLAIEGRLELALGGLSGGFRFVGEKTLVLSSSELFNRREVSRQRGRAITGRAIDSFLELREGDLVVHVAHGIGRYRGMKLVEKEGRAEEHLEVEYDGGTRIFVPCSKIELVQKYVGGKKLKPPLAKIGGKSWQRQKKAAEEAVSDLASDMLEVQARRDARPGIRYPDDTEWQREFDAAFPYELTPDQKTAVAAIKEDMQSPRPMDRLLCGDVGFGKTEVAMRAVFKAIDAGYQVAVLAPTTVLAEQHLRTFRERMAEFPFVIEGLSRFISAGKQKRTLAAAKEGGVDVLIGTHRLVSADIDFANLGLVIIDEEQRFGVAVKERLKALRSMVDVLTMTATPIPRTLHMALLGVRGISNLETPPADRLPVETRVTRFQEEMIRHALLRELDRDGQAYFVHNRVHDILNIAARLQQIVPEARIGVGHGQMADGELEEVMTRFVQHEYDVLLATTIIESGLDIPNANTMIIDDADRYGLSDLHQLRGRVGRCDRRSYCYLLVDEDRRLSPEAARRLRAIEEFSQLGAGFALSMRDLEIRGAGSLLGTQQSGHIATVGYELYCSLLENAVRQLKQLPPRLSVDVNIDLPSEAFLSAGYVGHQRDRIDLYRRLARAGSDAEVEDFLNELVDRFGAPPPPAERLIELARLRVAAHGWGVQSIRREGKYLVFGYTQRPAIRRLVESSEGRLRIADASEAYLPIPPDADTPNGLLVLAETLLRGGTAAA